MIEDTKRWFEAAIPKPTAQNLAVQIGCHMEEYNEMLSELLVPDPDPGAYIRGVQSVTEKIADQLKSGYCPVSVPRRKEMLDALADQIVTAVGIAHMMGMDIVGALGEVNRSNFSKFVDGKPVFKAGGKIAKGPNYSEPDLTPFI